MSHPVCNDFALERARTAQKAEHERSNSIGNTKGTRVHAYTHNIS